MLNTILTVVSLFVLILGLISMVTPIPGGTLLIAIGLTLLIYSSAKARLCIQWIRSRVGWVNKLFFWLEAKVGGKVRIVGETLEKTRPLEATVDQGLSHKEYVQRKLEEEAILATDKEATTDREAATD